MVWEPFDLAQTCPSDAQFAACSYFGYVYLKLLVQLYGDSADRRKQSCLEKDRIEKSHQEYARIEEILTNYDRDTISYGRERDEENGRIDDIGHIYDEDKYKIAHGTNNGEEYDFIVVGAGAAGCVVASRLTEHEFEVLLLEAGPEQPDITLVPSFAAGLIGSNIDWQFRSEYDGKSCLAQADQRCSFPAGRTMGGGSSINSMAYVRGNKLDYDTWAAMGNAGWSYKDVLPFFKKSEKNLNIENQNRKYHGVDGELTISRYPYIDKPSIMMTEAFNERGLPLNDYNGEDQVGSMQAQAFSQGGVRVSTNNAFIQPIRYKRKNLTVKVESLAVEILIDERNKAFGVTYLKNGTLYKATARKEVIVSAGPMNSPKLLMLSGIGPKDHLHDVGIKVAQDLPVGYNLHDHVTFDGILIVLPNGTATTVDNNHLINEVIAHKNMDIKDGPLSGNGVVNSVAFLKTDSSLPAPDIQFQADVVQSWREYIKTPAVYKATPVFPSAFYDGIIPHTMNLVPKSKGRLYLNSTDIYAPPIININYFDDDEDMKTLIKGVKFLLSLEKTRAFRENGAYFYKESLPPCEAYDWGTDGYLSCIARSYTVTTYHSVGTCKMGPIWDKEAVVDPRLRVYGVEGLRVIDSSIMPVVPRGNTNAPTIMVGERGVDLVLKDWGKQ